MTSKITVSQLDSEGFFVGLNTAFEDPMNPGSYLLPQNCVNYPAPNVRDGHVYQWNGSGWSEQEIPQQVEVQSSVELTPDEITANTIYVAVDRLQSVVYLTTGAIQPHMTTESQQEVATYIHDVANIMATAQQKYGTGEAYAPDFPPSPTVVPGITGPFVQFIVVN